MFASVELTNISCVVQPPPSAKWGNKTDWPTGAANSDTGKVVTRNSERSFVKPRKAITDTGSVDVKVNVPLTEVPPLKGDSFKKLAICARAGMVVEPCAKSTPSELVKKKDKDAA